MPETFGADAAAVEDGATVVATVGEEPEELEAPCEPAVLEEPVDFTD